MNFNCVCSASAAYPRDVTLYWKYAARKAANSGVSLISLFIFHSTQFPSILYTFSFLVRLIYIHVVAAHFQVGKKNWSTKKNCFLESIAVHVLHKLSTKWSNDAEEIVLKREILINHSRENEHGKRVKDKLILDQKRLASLKSSSSEEFLYI